MAGKGSAMGILSVVLLLMIGSFTVPLTMGQEAVPDGDFTKLMSLYNEETLDFEGLEDGGSFLLEDVVSVSVADSGNTQVWFVSTGGSLEAPSLTYPGEDIAERLLPGAKVHITVHIVERKTENGTEERIEASREGVVVVKEGEKEVPIDKDKMQIFWFNIERKWIPDDIETPWGEFFIMIILWSIATIMLWLIFHKVLLEIAKKTRTDLDYKVFSIMRIPFFLILLLYGLLISLSRVVADEFVDNLYSIYIAGTIILVTYVIARVFKMFVVKYLTKLAERTQTEADDVLIPIMSKIGTTLIWVVGVVLFLENLGLNITMFVAGVGVMGLVVAFAAQDTLSNLFAGIMIMLDRPFVEGDWIMMDDRVYQVKEIGLRSTRLHHTMSNQIITMPNIKINDHMFSNLNMPDQYGRTTLNVGTSYDTDPKEVGRILLEVAATHPDTISDKDHEPFYRFSEFGDSSLNFTLTFWVANFNDQWRVSSEIKEMIYHRFQKENIEIPFPQRVVHMRQEGPPERKRRPSRKGATDPGDLKNLAP